MTYSTFGFQRTFGRLVLKMLSTSHRKKDSPQYYKKIVLFLCFHSRTIPLGRRAITSVAFNIRSICISHDII